MPNKPMSCALCTRTFADKHSLFQHTMAKHGRKAAKPLRPVREDDEPSMADLVIEAHLARAMGDPVEDWIADMFDV